MKEKITRGLWLLLAAALTLATLEFITMIIDGSLIAVVLTPFSALVAMNIFETQLNKKQ